MKTKEELIKDAYGEHYDACEPNEWGWSMFEYWADLENPIWNVPMEEKETFNGDYWRPIALKGLEENGGWSSVKECGLPKVGGYYDIYVFVYGGLNSHATQKNIAWTGSEEESPAIWKYVKHYKPTENRLPMYE